MPMGQEHLLTDEPIRICPRERLCDVPCPGPARADVTLEGPLLRGVVSGPGCVEWCGRLAMPAMVAEALGERPLPNVLAA
ncbi:MAG TPA: hypothetical protein VF466_05115 [Candidatus Saccharimonadales bacterium]